MSSHKSRQKHALEDETTVTDLSIGPDGCIYVFGASYAVLEMIEAAGLGSDTLRQRLGQLRSVSENPSENLQNSTDKTGRTDSL
jgi:hypothetical protein